MQLVANGMSPEQTIACLHILEERENRMSVPAVLGNRMASYLMHLQVCQLFDGTGDEIVDVNDRLIENIKARIRSDPRMGQPPSAVFEAGQGRGDQIAVSRGPVEYLNADLANGTPIVWFGITWTATEQITA